MGTKDGCCGLCAWFSIIGSILYGILALMLHRKNQAVIEHKFDLDYSDDATIAIVMNQMIIISFVMLGAALVCFLSQFYYSRKEDKEL